MDSTTIRKIIEEEFHKRGINGGPIEELRADMYWVRNKRYGEARLKNFITKTLVTVLVGAGASVFFAGIISYLG